MVLFIRNFLQFGGVSGPSNYNNIYDGIFLLPFYIVSFLVSVWVVNVFKLKDEYKWLISSIIILFGLSFIDEKKGIILWSSIPVNIISYIIATKTSKDPFIIFLTFIGASTIIFWIITLRTFKIDLNHKKD